MNNELDHTEYQRVAMLVDSGLTMDAAIAKVRGAGKVPAPAPKKSKYGNIRCEADGFSFDSLKERDHYYWLKVLEDKGEITDLELQPVFKLTVQGVVIGKYIGDFRYKDKEGEVVLVDVKGREATKTPLYRRNKKHIKAQFGIDIQEV